MEQEATLQDDTDVLLASRSAGAAAASWNPAFRKNSDAVVDDEEDDFFNRYPGPTPKKEGDVMATAIMEEQPEPESPLRRSRASTRQQVDSTQLEVAPVNAESVARKSVTTERPISQVYYEEDDDEALLRDQEAPILSPEETRQEQEEALEHQMPDDFARDVDSDEPATLEGEESDDPADHYDHQGEVTEMEEAQEPSVEASLLNNEEPPPTSGFISREPTFSIQSREPTMDLEDSSSSRPFQARPPPLDRSFTTNFSESPVEPPQRHIRSISEQWPSIGDDQTFGELLDNQNLEDNREWAQEQGERDALQSIAEKESEQVASPDLDLLPEGGPEAQEGDLDAAWGAALDDDDLLEETPTDLDPSHFFDEDDDGFLEDEPFAAPPAPVQSQPAQSQRNASAPQYRPANLQSVPPKQQQPGIPSPSFFDQNTHGRSAGTPSTGLYDVHSQQPQMYQQPAQPQRPQTLQQQGHAQSFADKSKGGYQSPYDLPMEVVKPRRRPQQFAQQPTPAQTPGPPPLRKSSLGSPVGGQPPFSQLAGQPPSLSSLSPPNSRGSTGSGGAPAVLKSPPKNAGGSGFFEELPMTTKPRARPAPASAAQTMPTVPTLSSQMPQMSPQQQQQQNMYQTAAGPISPPRRQNNAYPQGQISPQRGVSQQQSGAFGGLRQPERMPLLPDQPMPQPQTQQPPAQQLPPVNARYSPQSNVPVPAPPPSLPAVQNRYSPAPTATTTSQPPAATTRYSPAPTSQPQQKPRQTSAPVSALPGMPANPFAPRTSSPLAAYTDRSQPVAPTSDAGVPPRAMAPPTSPPKVNGLRRSPPETSVPSTFSPEKTRAIDPSQQFGPPLPRPQTQSPDNSMKMQKIARPGSDGITSAPPQPASRPKGPVLPHRRQSSRQLTFAAPQDERSMDPLQRWKGHPIFKWGASGTVLSSFPKHTPFYAAGNVAPSLKCTPGSITVQDASQFMPMDERNAKFPGPLAARSKGRKKDVLTWMTAKIEDLEEQTKAANMDFTMPRDLKIRTEEKLVLWKIMRIFVENDGILEGNAKIDEEVRRVLVPNLAQLAQVAELSSPGATVQRDAVDKSITLQLRQALLEGKREHAVWLAEEKRLWGHAMLIASTMGPETWKQIVQAFVRNQVKSFGSDARSLAALYHIFAGNSEECVDELVPPSARAGFQMISMTDGSVAGNPLEGLDQWRETLDLVTSNRTPNDAASLISLGKLLAGYGRVEAAHTCYLFSKTLVKHSGPDDPDAHFVLLGANHQASDENFGNDLDSILLTEIYEYATSLSAPSKTGSYIPHLQAFKLVHAQMLAAHGLKTKAQTYCDAITTAYTSTTRPSPYYHPIFTQSVADMSTFLSQTPHDSKAGLFSRPAMNKVSSGASSWFSNSFTKFVSGDDDQDASDSGAGGAGSDGMGGPFGGVHGDSGSISRNASGTELYNPMMGDLGTPGMQPPFAPSSVGGRYAPGGQVGSTPSRLAQQYSSPSLPAAEPQRSVSSRYAPPPSAGSSLGVPASGLSRKASDHSLPYAPNSRRGSAQDTSSQGSYEPRPILADEGSAYGYSPVIHSPPTHSPSVASPLVLAQQAPAVQEPEDAFDGPNGLSQPLNDEVDLDAEGGGGYIPPTGGYEPPEYSYQPYEPEPDSPEEERPKRRQFGDEDEDVGASQKLAAAAKKAQADREADELVRKAAEADAARDKEKAAQKKGWFGWFGGSRDSTASPGPIKAKLGEESSFYYDENLKKWVNKKAGPEAATSAAPTPPPPKGPASRVASASMGPPSGPPSRTSSGSGLANMNTNRPPTSGSAAPMSAISSGPPSRSGTPSSNPPSESGAPPLTAPSLNGSSLGLPLNAARPSSSLSNASSIDDLLGGPPGSRKGGTVKKKKGGRYVDVMAQ